MATVKGIISCDPLSLYTMDHSIRLTEVQKRLNETTLQHEHRRMLGASDVLQLNANLMQVIGAKKVLDVGVFTGASALSAALALPSDGRVFALDVSLEFTNIARKFWDEAGVSDKIELIIAPATDTLQGFIDQGQAGTFDFAFIDADKPNYDRYYEQCLTLIRPGGVVAFDNTLWSGRVIDDSDQSENTVAIRKLNNKLRDDDRINISFLKIGDGLTLCFKK